MLLFWADAGFDGQHARFHERLDWHGKPTQVPHRAMVQARQIYVFAHAAQLGWFPEGAQGQAGEARISIGSDGPIVSPTRNAYAHAFVLFAIGGLHRLNGNPQLLALADRVIASMSTLPTAAAPDFWTAG